MNQALKINHAIKWQFLIAHLNLHGVCFSRILILKSVFQKYVPLSLSVSIFDMLYAYNCISALIFTKIRSGTFISSLNETEMII